MEKWPFLDQKRGLIFLKNVNFLTFLTFRFYSLERWFLVLKYRKRLFPGLYCLKKKLEKWPFLDQKHGLTLWKNVNFLTFWTFRFYSPERSLFVLEHRKTHLPGLQCLKKKVEKWPFLDQKHGFTLWKNVNFFTFWTFFFIAYKLVFWF